MTNSDQYKKLFEALYGTPPPYSPQPPSFIPKPVVTPRQPAKLFIRRPKVFFSFHFKRDAWRVGQVRNSQVVANYPKNPFFKDGVEWEKVKASGDVAVQNWIEKQLKDTEVTVVLIGLQTASRRWVKYEIKRSIELQKGIIGVHISGIKNQDKEWDKLGPNPLPAKYKTYKWNADNGRENLGKWITAAMPRRSS